jgi:hypothetical protein
MKYIKIIPIALIVFFFTSTGFAQHTLEVDDGLGHISTIAGGNPGGKFLLPNAPGTLLTNVGLSSLAWLTIGNVGTNPTTDPLTFDPLIHTYLGTDDNKELDFVTNGAVRARFKESTGDTITAGSFEPGLANTYSLGTMDRPWKGLYVSPGTITFTASTAHSPGQGNPTPQAINFGTLSYDENSSTFMFDHPLGFTGGGSVTTSSVTITGLASANGGLVKADPAGLLSLAGAGSDFELPLTFASGLTRTSNTINLGGSVTGTTTFTGSGSFAFNETGSFKIGALASGLVKSTSGTLSIATAGTDYQAPMTQGDGISIVTNKISLGGSFTNDVTIIGNSKNFNLTNPGDFGIGVSSPTTGLLEVQCTTKTAFHAVAGGSTGSAGDFTLSNGANTSHAVVISNSGNGNSVDASTSGTGWAGHFNGSGASSKGVYVSGATGQTGLQVNSGDVILSHTNQATGAFAIGAGSNSVIAVSNGTPAGYNITLNTGTNGQIVYVYNGDALGTATFVNGTSALHAQNTGGNTVAPGATKILIYVTNAAGSGWVTK